MVDFVICSKCGEREYASGEHVCPREPLTLDETEERLIKAWRRSGMTLGYLIVGTASDNGLSTRMFCERMSDKTATMMLEAHARSHGQKAADGAPKEPS